MRRLSHFVLPFASLCTAQAAIAQPADEPVRFTAEVSAGVLADTDVGLADLDQSTRKGDSALKLGAEIKAAPKLTLRGSYEFSDTQYQEFEAFNLQTHLATGEAAYSFGKTDAGVLVAYADARLDGSSYLTLSQVSPFLQHTITPAIIARGTYVRGERDYKTDDGRDATSDEIQIDSFFLIDGTRRYVIVGASAGQSEADDATFSYSGGGGKARFINRFALLGKDAKLRLGADFEIREFDAVPPTLTEARRDELVSGTGEVNIPITGPVSIDLGYEFRARQSNLAAADYDEHVGRAALKVTF